MKKKEFLTAVILICIFGMALTYQVRRFVSGNVQITRSFDEREAKVASDGIPFDEKSVRKPQPNEAERRLQNEKLQNGSFQNRNLEDSQKQSTTASQTPGEENITQESLTTETEGSAVPQGEEGVSLPEVETEEADKSVNFAETGDGGQMEAEGQTSMGLRVILESLTLSSPAEAEGLKAVGLPQEEKQSETSESSEEPALASEVQDDSFPAVGVSPRSVPGGEAESEEMTEQAYRRELDETAALIEKLKNSETSTTAWSYLNMADYELKLWDEQLNVIYEDIMGRLEPEAAETLRQEERKWISEKDAAAKRAASRCRGGALEGLEHTASLAASTKERAYDLLDSYGNSLPQEEK